MARTEGTGKTTLGASRDLAEAAVQDYGAKVEPGRTGVGAAFAHRDFGAPSLCVAATNSAAASRALQDMALESAEGTPFSSGTFRCVVSRLAGEAAQGALLALFTALSTNGFARVEVLSWPGLMTKAIGSGASALGSPLPILCRQRVECLTESDPANSDRRPLAAVSEFECVEKR